MKEKMRYNPYFTCDKREVKLPRQVRSLVNHLTGSDAIAEMATLFDHFN